MGLANAKDLGPTGIIELRHALGDPKVVALGKEAARVADSSGVPFGSVPHPQYHRRFHHMRPSLYRDAIDRALVGAHVTSFPIPPAGEGWEIESW